MFEYRHLQPQQSFAVPNPAPKHIKHEPLYTADTLLVIIPMPTTADLSFDVSMLHISLRDQLLTPVASVVLLPRGRAALREAPATINTVYILRYCIPSPAIHDLVMTVASISKYMGFPFLVLATLNVAQNLQKVTAMLRTYIAFIAILAILIICYAAIPKNFSSTDFSTYQKNYLGVIAMDTIPLTLGLTILGAAMTMFLILSGPFLYGIPLVPAQAMPFPPLQQQTFSRTHRNADRFAHGLICMIKGPHLARPSDIYQVFAIYRIRIGTAFHMPAADQIQLADPTRCFPPNIDGNEWNRSRTLCHILANHPDSCNMKFDPFTGGTYFQRSGLCCGHCETRVNADRCNIATRNEHLYVSRSLSNVSASRHLKGPQTDSASSSIGMTNKIPVSMDVPIAVTYSCLKTHFNKWMRSGRSDQ